MRGYIALTVFVVCFAAAAGLGAADNCPFDFDPDVDPRPTPAPPIGEVVRSEIAKLLPPTLAAAETRARRDALIDHYSAGAALATSLLALAICLARERAHRAPQPLAYAPIALRRTLRECED